MPIGNIFGETIRLFRRHSTLFMALAALQILPQVVAALLLDVTGITRDSQREIEAILNELNSRLEAAQGTGGTDFLLGFPWGHPYNAIIQLLIWSMVILFIQYFVFRTLAMGASVAAVGDAYRTGEPRFGAALGAALGQLGQLFLWAILSGVGFFALILLLLIPLCGLFIWAGVLAFLAMRLIFVPQIIVAEDANAFAAMSRSWELTRGSFWRVFGAWLLFVLLINIFASLVAGVVTGVVIGAAGSESSFSQAFSLGAGGVIGLITTPLAYIGFTLLYYDHQRRATAQPPAPPPPSYPTYQ